jgi:hypothetical protein
MGAEHEEAAVMRRLLVGTAPTGGRLTGEQAFSSSMASGSITRLRVATLAWELLGLHTTIV